MLAVRTALRTSNFDPAIASLLAVGSRAIHSGTARPVNLIVAIIRHALGLFILHEAVEARTFRRGGL
jgi:hypothetical protein